MTNQTEFTIQQTAELTGLSPHTLRYYERIGLLQGIARSPQGYRYYSQADLLWIEFLLRLRDTGMPIQEMLKFSELRHRGRETVSARREMLETHRDALNDQIRQLQQHVQSIDSKIVHYRKVEEKE